MEPIDTLLLVTARVALVWVLGGLVAEHVPGITRIVTAPPSAEP